MLKSRNCESKYLQNLKPRSSCQRCSIKKDVLKNFVKFRGKHMCRSLFLNKVTGLFYQKCEFCEIFKNSFFTESALASEYPKTNAVEMIGLYRINVQCSFSK